MVLFLLRRLGANKEIHIYYTCKFCKFENNFDPSFVAIESLYWAKHRRKKFDQLGINETDHHEQKFKSLDKMFFHKNFC